LQCWRHRLQCWYLRRYIRVTPRGRGSGRGSDVPQEMFLRIQVGSRLTRGGDICRTLRLQHWSTSIAALARASSTAWPVLHGNVDFGATLLLPQFLRKYHSKLSNVQIILFLPTLIQT
jgi:hypothetical protein